MLVLVGLMVLSMGSVALAASIKTSKHDLSSTGHVDVRTDDAQVCVFCHTPHNARTVAPLWNRNASPATTYTLYRSETLDATIAQPVEGSRNVATQGSGSDLCLSCHDGTLAVTNVVKYDFTNTGRRTSIAPDPTAAALDSGGFLKSTRTANLGTDLSNDHPVGFSYAAAKAAEDTRLSRGGSGQPASQLAGVVTRGAQTFVSGAANPSNGTGVDLPLFAGKMECDTCHNVHDPGTDGGSQTLYPFLRGDMNASKLCFTCHIK